MKYFLKKAAYLISLAVISPLLLVDCIEKKLSKREDAFVFMAQLLSLIPGLLGSCLRSAYYASTLERASHEFHIGFGSIFCHRAATVGRYTSIGMYCIFGRVHIGEKVMFANRVSIPSGKRQHLCEAGGIDHKTRYETINVGNRTWIGEGAVIMADVGENSIVGAGSVVTRALPPGITAVGNPAKVLRSNLKDGNQG